MGVAMAQTQVVPILGLLQSELNTSSSRASWITTATLLSAAVFTPLLGRVGDQYGKKPTLIAVLGVMVAGSLLAAVTTSLPLLIVARALQGSATAIFPLALSVVRDEVTPHKLPGAMAMISGTLAFGSGLSLVSTGLLTQGDDPDYHLVFWFSTGLAVIALAACALLIPVGRNRTGGRIDFLGSITLAVALVLLLLAISQGHGWGWSSRRVVGCFVGAVVMAALWVAVERRVANPLVDMRMFVHRQVLFTNIAGLFIGFGSFAQFIGISFLVQIPSSLTGYGFGASVLRASVEYRLPGALMSLAAAPVGGALVRRIGARRTLALGGAIGAAGFAWLAWGHGATPNVILAGMLTGISIAFGFAAMPALIAASVPLHQTGVANSVNSISRSVGSAIASAVVASLLASKTVAGLPAGLPPLPAESQFTLSFAIAAGALLLATAAALFGLGGRPRSPSASVATSMDSLPGRATAPAASVHGRHAHHGGKASGVTPAAAPADYDPAEAEPATDLFRPPVDTARTENASTVTEELALVHLIRGTVHGSDGSPAVSTVLTLVNAGGHQIGRTITGDDGRYTLATPGSGTFVLIAASADHAPQANTLTVGAQPVDFDLILANTRQLTGCVTSPDGIPVQDATLVLTDLNGEVVTTGTSAADGSFAFTGLTGGSYTLAASAPASHPTATPVDVTGTGPTIRDMTLLPARRISGTVRRRGDKAPVSGIRVTLMDAETNAVGAATTGPDGTYAFSDLPSDRYTVIATGYPQVTTSLDLAERDSTDAHDIWMSHPA
ncbi:MFS transporter [Streptomyces sp. NPDC059766]|uniref:MFS transporter n=1 Tax=Streptomyces sp. NPDC059766 TaxID=3346940 RepID=UPI00365E09FD